MFASRARARLVAALLLITLPGAVLLAVPAAAQEEPGNATVNLLGQPVWHDDDDDLGLVLRVTNGSGTTLDGFRLQVRLYPVISTRSDLDVNLSVDPARIEASSLPSHDVAVELLPGRSEIVRIDDPVASLTSLAGVTQAGVYPLTVTLATTDGLVEDSLTTFLLYFPGDVESPLQIVPVWVMATLPSKGPDGAFLEHPVTRDRPLENALAGRGWLAEILTALETRAGRRVRMGLAAGGRTVEEIADLADGYERSDGGGRTEVRPNEPVPRAATDALARLRAMVEQRRIQPLVTPYAFPDLPAIAGDLDRMQVQLSETEDVLQATLGAAPGRGWIFPPAGRVDARTIADLHALDAGASTFFTEDALEGAEVLDTSCPPTFEGATYTCPVKVDTVGGRSRGYVLDPVLQNRLAAMARSGSTRISLQRVFAELAMIWAELPNDPDRIVPVVFPSGWQPPPRGANLMIRTLGRAPWLVTRTPRGGLHRGIGAGARQLVPELAPKGPGDLSYDALASVAENSLHSFSRIDPPAELLTRLNRDLAIAHSRMWAPDPLLLERGAAYARAVENDVEDRFERIRVGGSSEITLTSRTGEIPLILFNENDFGVRVVVEVDWRDLSLDIAPDEIQQRFAPGRSPLPIEATARASGIFLVEVLIRTPDGEEIDSASISVRSTEFNEIALAITLGALGFLVLFYVGRGFRRRSSGTERP